MLNNIGILCFCQNSQLLIICHRPIISLKHTTSLLRYATVTYPLLDLFVFRFFPEARM
jgi:hypothetical protein